MLPPPQLCLGGQAGSPQPTHGNKCLPCAPYLAHCVESDPLLVPAAVEVQGA